MHINKFINQLANFPFKLTIKSLVCGIIFITASARTNAQGDLLISPLRVVFEGSKKSQEINLANVGKDTATYVISVQDIKMNEDGSFEQITQPEPGQNFAGPFLRFFPRKVTLAPNEAQVVKMQLVKTSELKPGEYRSHLYFRAVPEEKPLGEKPTKKDSASISIELKPIFGITIPAIIRVGDYDANVALADMSLDMSNNSTSSLSFTFKRTGSMSVYGDIIVDYITPNGKSTQVKIVKGVGVYTPNASRRFKVELDNDNHVNFHDGKIHVTYAMQMSDKAVKNVEAEITLK